MYKNKIILILVFIINVLCFLVIKKNLDIYYEKIEIENYITNKEEIEETNNKTNKKNDILGVIEIKNLNIKRMFYNYYSNKNNVSKNVMLIENSDMPDINNGNLILAAHRGTSKVAFFNNLHKLSETDEIVIYYNSKKYIYKYNNRYDVEKTGKVKIIRDTNQTTLTLITCKKGTSKQTVFINYLVDIINM